MTNNEAGMCGGKGDASLAKNTAEKLGVTSKPVFTAGFLDKANEIRGAGRNPGTPVEDAWTLRADANGAPICVVQATSEGLMWWASGGPPLFFVGE